MLGKPEFDCADLGEFYDCGCGGDEEASEGKEGSAASRSDTGKGSSEHHDGPAVEISKEELVTSPLWRIYYGCLVANTRFRTTRG